MDENQEKIDEVAAAVAVRVEAENAAPAKKKASNSDIKARVLARIDEENTLMGRGSKKGGNGKDEIPIEFILDCLEMGALGDGLLNARANSGEKIFNATVGAWYTWAGHRWELDIENKALAAVGKVTDLYEKAANSLSLEINKATDLPYLREHPEVPKWLVKRDTWFDSMMATRASLSRTSR